MELLLSALRNHSLQVGSANYGSQYNVASRIATNDNVNVCVTVKERKGSKPSTGVSSQPRNTSPLPCGGPGQRGCSAGSPAATRCCAAAATSRATTWSGIKLRCTCWVHDTVVHINTAHAGCRIFTGFGQHICGCVCVCVGLDPDDFESEEKSEKSKNPNSIQGGKWQLGFQGDFI